MPSAYNIDAAEDITGQAGWMFSDMLVALMVVFLATITFIPQFSGGDSSVLDPGSSSGTSETSGSGSGSYTYSEHFSAVFIRAYSANDVSGVLVDIQAFMAANKIPNNSVLDSAQFVGGYDQGTENSGIAISRASNFSTRLETAYPGILEHASTVLNSSPKLAADIVTIRVTFSAKVTVKR
jgi:hypothetical protein